MSTPEERRLTGHDKIGVLYSPHASDFGKVVLTTDADYAGILLAWPTRRPSIQG